MASWRMQKKDYELKSWHPEYLGATDHPKSIHRRSQNLWIQGLQPGPFKSNSSHENVVHSEKRSDNK